MKEWRDWIVMVLSVIGLGSILRIIEMNFVALHPFGLMIYVLVMFLGLGSAIWTFCESRESTSE